MAAPTPLQSLLPESTAPATKSALTKIVDRRKDQISRALDEAKATGTLSVGTAATVTKVVGLLAIDLALHCIRCRASRVLQYLSADERARDASSAPDVVPGMVNVRRMPDHELFRRERAKWLPPCGDAKDLRPITANPQAEDRPPLEPMEPGEIADDGHLLTPMQQWRILMNASDRLDHV